MELIRNVCRERGIACLVNLHQVDAAARYTGFTVSRSSEKCSRNCSRKFRRRR
jgi:ABC-type phosphate/phosphonate transport system ATPase subunit